MMNKWMNDDEWIMIWWMMMMNDNEWMIEWIMMMMNKWMRWLNEWWMEWMMIDDE